LVRDHRLLLRQENLVKYERNWPVRQLKHGINSEYGGMHIIMSTAVG